MTIAVTTNGYQTRSIKEGEAPFLMSRVTDKSGGVILQAAISTIKATIINRTTGATVLNESALTISSVWSDTYVTTADWTGDGGDSTGYNFGWQTLATYFTTTTTNESCHYRVEVWVTPTSGQPFEACWWEITAKASIVPIPT